MEAAACPLCASAGGVLLFERPQYRVIRAQEAGFPAFYRLVWNTHMAEFSDLGRADRALCMDGVACIEQALRDHLQPDKVNLAALGNMVPHLHWHVIARYRWDSHFPAPVWAGAQRQAPPERIAALEAALPALEKDLIGRLAATA